MPVPAAVTTAVFAPGADSSLYGAPRTDLSRHAGGKCSLPSCGQAPTCSPGSPSPGWHPCPPLMPRGTTPPFFPLRPELLPKVLQEVVFDRGDMPQLAPRHSMRTGMNDFPDTAMNSAWLDLVFLVLAPCEAFPAPNPDRARWSQMEPSGPGRSPPRRQA